MCDFDKELFMKLCEKYNVEMSKTAKSPMIKSEYGIYPIDDYNSYVSDPENILLAAHTIIQDMLDKMACGEYTSELHSFEKYKVAQEVISEIFCYIKKNDEREVLYEE